MVHPIRPQRSWTDTQGFPSYWQDKDETETRTLDWTRELSGDTIATSTWTATGITIDSTSNTTTSTTATLSGSKGITEVTNTITTAQNRILTKTIRIYERVK